jgi:virulence factor Mce-like protein
VITRKTIERILAPADVYSNPLLMGTTIIAVSLIALVLSYNASRGLPFVPTYAISVDVPDAAQLTPGGSEVRIGGARVGFVKTIRPLPGRNGAPAFARLRLALDRRQQGLPVDSMVQVRPRSILGAKYLDLVPGKSARQVPPGGLLGLSQAKPVVDFDEAFGTFDRATVRNLRSVITALGDGFAGRGAGLNETIGATALLMDPLRRVSALVAAPETDLRGFVRGAAAAAGAIAPVAGAFGAMLDNGATTLRALDRADDALSETLIELTPTEAVGTRALTTATPVLADAVRLVRGLRPGTRLLPTGTRKLAAAVRSATPVLLRIPRLADRTDPLLASLRRLSRVPAASGSLRELSATVTSLGRTLRLATPAQTHCNVAGLFGRNVPGIVSQGDADGTWTTTLLVVNGSQVLQNRDKSYELNTNYYPIEDATECESGNELFKPSGQIGNPAGNQGKTYESTAPPPGVTARAGHAGLLGPRRAGR